VWVVAGLLLGLVVLASLIGFHSGPHVHLAAGVCGALAAVALISIAATGGASALLWVLLAVDLTLSVGVGFLAWRGLSGQTPGPTGHHDLVATGSEGIAVSELDPFGIVRVRGEDWSAEAINPPVRRGTKVQVVGRGGVRLDVWGEDSITVVDDIVADNKGADGSRKEGSCS
jgi:membrane-bound ClpP family serine protease